MEAFKQGNFQMAGSGHRVSGIDCWAKPPSQGRASTSYCPGVIQLPSALSLLRLGCMLDSQGPTRWKTKVRMMISESILIEINEKKRTLVLLYSDPYSSKPNYLLVITWIKA